MSRRSQSQRYAAACALAVLLGVVLWALDAAFEHAALPPGAATFWKVAVSNAGPRALAMRVAHIGAFVLLALLVVRARAVRARLRNRLRHTGQVLAAIRSVNQLITQETDVGRLLGGACNLLVEKRRFQSAWVVLTKNGRPVEPFAHAGLDEGFEAMLARLRQGELPNCGRNALESPEVHVTEDPAEACRECCLSSSHEGAPALSVRLEHSGRVFGWLCVTVPSGLAQDDQEHGLLHVVADDLAHALWALKGETQRQSLEEKYAAAMASSSEAVLEADLDGYITLFTPRAEELYECAAEDSLGSHISRFCPEDRLEQQAELFRQVKETGLLRGVETEGITARGRRVPIEVSVSLRDDEDGRPIGTSSIIRDITERKRAEAALRESEEKHRAIFEKAGVLVSAYDRDLKCVLMNEVVANLFGGTPDDFIGKSMHELHPQQVEEYGARMLDAMDSGQVKTYEDQVAFPEGPRWLLSSVFPLRETKGEIVAAQIVSQDITERVEREMRYAQVLATAIDGFWVVSAEGRILEVNPAAAEMLGYTVEEMLQITVRDINAYAPEARMAQRMAEVRERGHGHLESKHKRKDGSVIDVEISASFQDTAGGRFFAFIRDVTERKRNEAELLRSKQLLEAVVMQAPFGAYIVTGTPDDMRVIMENAESERMLRQRLRDAGPIRVDGNDLVCRFFTRDGSREVSLLEVPTLRALGGETVAGEEYLFRHSDGTELIVRAGSSPVRGEDGAIVAVVTVFQDITAQVQTEQALRTALSEQEAIFDSCMVGISVLSNRVIMKTNRRWDEIFGYARNELLGQTTECLYRSHEDFLDLGQRCYPRLAAGEMVEMEYPFRRKDGQAIWCFLVGKAFAPPDASSATVWVFDDITERRDAEQQLRLQSLVLEQIADRITVTGLDGRITYVNDAACRMLGHRREDLIGQHVSVYGEDPAVGAAQDEIVSKTLTQGEWRGEVANLDAQGKRVILDARTHIVRDAAGKPVALCGISTDITERKHSEETLRNRLVYETALRTVSRILLSAADYDAAMQESLEALRNASDAKRVYLFENFEDPASGPCMREAYEACAPGAPPQLDNPQWQKVPYAGEAQRWWDTLSQGSPIVGPVRAFPEEERRFLESQGILSLLALPVFVDSRFHGFIGFNETEYEREWDENDVRLLFVAAEVIGSFIARKHAEEERQRIEEQYRQAQKMEAVGQLTGGVAHDFNNLLQVINGMTDIALMDIEPNHPVRESLEEVAKAGERAARLVSQLLLFSRRQVMRPEVLDLNDTIADLLKMLGRVIGEHIRLEWSPGPHVGAIFADRGMIEQALLNLCVNARDAMPEGGVLTIETHDALIDAGYCATHSWAEPGRFALLTVSDTGAGMDAETLEHIFEPFFTTKEPNKGTGLGLATVYGIVRQHEGMVHAYSEPGRGTVFKLYWPVCGEQDTESASEEGPEGMIGGAETILLAEDDEMVCRFARAILERVGYTVLVATNGAEALALFREHMDDINLAVLDVVMPEMGGHDAYNEMRKLQPGLKVLFASGYSETAIHTNFVLDPGLTLIQKPYTAATFLKAVRETLDASKR